MKAFSLSNPCQASFMQAISPHLPPCQALFFRPLCVPHASCDEVLRHQHNRGSATGSLPARIYLISSGSQIYWTTCCSFCSPCCLTEHFYAMEMLLFFSLVNQPLLASDFFSAACLTSLVFIELKRVRASLWNRLWLKEILRLVCSSIQTTTNFSTSLITFFSLVSFGCSLEQHFSFPSGPFPLHSQFGYLVRKAYLSVYLGF